MDSGPITDSFPSLASHATNMETTVRQVLLDGLDQHLKPRLSTAARQELATLQNTLHDISLTQQNDKRLSPLIDIEGILKTGMLYKLINQ